MTNWEQELLDEVYKYDNVATEEEEYRADTNSSTELSVKKFNKRYGLTKIVTRHFREQLMNFERHLYLKNGIVVYAHYLGISPRIKNGSVAPDFLIFNKQYFFENKSKGVRHSQQIISKNFKKKDSVIYFLERANKAKSDIYVKEHQELMHYYNEVTSLKPQ